MTNPKSSRWTALSFAGFAVILALSTWFSATAITPELIQEWGLSAEQAGWLTNAVQIGFVCGALGSSLLSIADVVRLQRLMAASAIVAAISNATLLLALGLEWAIVARFMTGVSLAGIYPPAMKYIATWFKTGRGLALGVMVGALTVGSAAPHLVRGLGASIAWQSVIIVSSLACLAAGIIILTLKDGPYPFASARVDLRQFGRVVRNRPAMLANFGYFGHMWELYAMWGWFLAYVSASIADGNNVFAGNASMLVFAAIALGGPGCVLGGLLSDKIGRCHTTIAMLLISGSCAVLVGVFFDGPSWMFAIVALVWGLTVVADSAQFSAAVTELSDPKLVGSMLAFQMGVGFAITVFAIWLVPQVADWLGGWRWTFLVLAPGPIFGIASMSLLRRHPAAEAMAGGRK